LGVATCCGRCEGCARDLVEQCSMSHPMAALHLNVPLAPGASAGV
jgi:bacterioferritin-associated ferredoxin